MTAGDKMLSAHNLSKRYGEIVALDNVDLELGRGEVLGLAGDNGAGKSTLIGCFSGAVQPDTGRVMIDGDQETISNTRVAKELGVQTTFQNLALAPNLTVTQNIFLTQEKVFGPGILRKGKMRQRAEELLNRLQIDVDPTSKVSNLSGGERQLVAISRTMLTEPKIIIMDEPTSALSVEGADRVQELIDRMQSEGISIIVIGHNLEWLQEVTDRIVVLHNGKNAGDFDVDSVTRNQLVDRMVSGRRTEADA